MLNVVKWIGVALVAGGLIGFVVRICFFQNN
jgi:hypothetical protein